MPRACTRRWTFPSGNRCISKARVVAVEPGVYWPLGVDLDLPGRRDNLLGRGGSEEESQTITLRTLIVAKLRVYFRAILRALLREQSYQQIDFVDHPCAC